jgi:hypothetical protein
VFTGSRVRYSSIYFCVFERGGSHRCWQRNGAMKVALCDVFIDPVRHEPLPFSVNTGPVMRIAHPRKFSVLDAMVLITAVAVAFVPISLVLWENWHFPEEWSVPEIGRAGLEINVSLVPLALSLSAAILLLGMKKPRSNIRRAFRKPGIAACTVALVYADLSAIGYAVFLHFCYALDRGVFDDRSSAMLWIRIGMQPIFLVGGAVASVWIVMWLNGTWRAEPSWTDRAGRALGIYWIAISVFFGWAFFLWG